jgi:hypothetical protein
MRRSLVWLRRKSPATHICRRSWLFQLRILRYASDRYHALPSFIALTGVIQAIDDIEEPGTGRFGETFRVVRIRMPGSSHFVSRTSTPSFAVLGEGIAPGSDGIAVSAGYTYPVRGYRNSPDTYPRS